MMKTQSGYHQTDLGLQICQQVGLHVTVEHDRTGCEQHGWPAGRQKVHVCEWMKRTRFGVVWVKVRTVRTPHVCHFGHPQNELSLVRTRPPVDVLGPPSSKFRPEHTASPRKIALELRLVSHPNFTI
jgi:hypothetical protein